MRNMKGFVFTLDAIFALIVTAAATSLLLLSLYTPTTQIQGTQTESLSISQSFMQSTMGQAAGGGGFARIAATKWNSGQYVWSQYGNDSAQSSSTPGTGPAYPFVMFTYQTLNVISPTPAVSDGLLVFTTYGANSQIYALNASTGTLVFNTPANTLYGSFIADPVMHNHLIYTMTAGDYLDAYTENGALAWSSYINLFPVAGGTTLGASGEYYGNYIGSYADSPTILSYEGGLLQMDGILINPLNGSIVPGEATTLSSYTQTTPTIYGNGRFATIGCSAAAESPNCPAVVTSLINGNTINYFNGAQFYAYLDYEISPVGSYGNRIYGGIYQVNHAGSGSQAFNWTYSATASNIIWQKKMNAQVQAGPAVTNGSVYIGAYNTIYDFSSSGNQIFTMNTLGYTLAAPSLAQGALYLLSDGNTLYDINPSTGALIWNVTLPGSESIAYYTSSVSPGVSAGEPEAWPLQDIPIAYGNAYVAVGNVIYAVGTCKADPNSGLLQAIATLYLNNGGGCATNILNQSYGYSKVAVFINNTYAPSLQVASFTGNSYLYQNDFSEAVYNTPISMSVWLYQNANPSSSGFISGFSDSAQDNRFYLRQDSSSNSVSGCFATSETLGVSLCEAANVIPNSWNHLVLVYNGTYLALYVNDVLADDGAVSPTGYYIGESNLQLSIGGSLIPGSNPGYMLGDVSDLQMYDYALSSAQVQSLYSEGTGGMPLQGEVAWLPLDGDPDNYLGTSAVFEVNSIKYTRQPSTPPGLQDSYQISKSTLPLNIDVNGNYINYNVGVVVWR